MQLLWRTAGFICLFASLSLAEDTKAKAVELKDGASLLRMGTLFDNPLLRMLGKVFMHTECLVGQAKNEIFEDLCDLHPCSPWSEWSNCTSDKYNVFGIQTRKRQCGVDSPFCIQPRVKDEKPTEEQGTQICEGFCPENYTLLSSGYCLKYYSESVNKENADEICADDHAFVININSKSKSDALHEMLTKEGVGSETIWIDGRRKDIYSSWSFKYESAPDQWTNWYGGEPSDSGNQYCRVEENSPRKWFDRNCDGPYFFVCEKPRR